ncbi:SAM-dependent methyltransferase [Candidatus Sulfobium mesophilum]|uniref:SAM-dependent methyltransferase n=1 Tax=Candidatus Sulfobium mesophilum TaxID=2016548 RepID=A0A2U3QL19_9BACT|nr:SAM-dependent methyltransferase [Candidatus Sulfobium mesophilum]
MTDFRRESGPDELLTRYSYLFSDDLNDSPVLDLACGDGHNGIFLASKGFSVVLADRSEEALSQARLNAPAAGMSIQFWQVNLEQEGVNPLEGRIFSAVLVFRYLHRPLIPCISKSLKQGGILIYETFTTEQARFGKPKNPDHLLKAGELLSWFQDWEVIYTYEGIIGAPPKAIARLVSRKT